MANTCWHYHFTDWNSNQCNYTNQQVTRSNQTNDVRNAPSELICGWSICLLNCVTMILRLHWAAVVRSLVSHFSCPHWPLRRSLDPIFLVPGCGTSASFLRSLHRPQIQQRIINFTSSWQTWWWLLLRPTGLHSPSVLSITMQNPGASIVQYMFVHLESISLAPTNYE